MKVYVMETVIFDDYIPHVNVINISSTFENAILFIKKCLEDAKGRIEPNSFIQIVEETIDSYHDDARLIDRLTAQEWLDNGEKIAININNYKKLLEHVVDQEEVSCYDLQS